MKLAGIAVRAVVVWLAVPLPAGAFDCNGNGISDFTDLTSGASRDCNLNGFPDECDIAPVNYGLRFLRAIDGAIGAFVVVTGDFDGDRDIDVAFTSQFEGAFGMARNRGNGLFDAPVLQPTDDQPMAMVAGDIDGDGDLDAALAGISSLAIFANNGRGSFLPLRSRLTAPATGLATTDFDGDSDLDFACAGSLSVQLFVNNGGFFSAGENHIVGSDPRVITAGDLNGDGAVDLATGNGEGNVSILLGSGPGTFLLPRNFGFGTAPSAITVSDLDLDRDLDLVVTDQVGTIVILPNPGDADFSIATPLKLSNILFGLLAADLDGDGDPDLAAGNPEQGGISAVLNHGNGGFTGPAFFGALGFTSVISSLAAADLDGDGSLEVVTADQGMGNLQIYGRQAVAYRPDCDRNGVPDDCQLGENDCNSNRIPDGCDLSSGASKDCNGNGRPDECESDCNRNRLPDDCDLAAGTSRDCNFNDRPDECDVAGTIERLRPAEVKDLSGGAFAFDIADFIADGLPDIVVGSPEGLALVRNDGGGTFQKMKVILPGEAPFIFQSPDLDESGSPDLVLSSSRDQSLRVLLNRGPGVFEEGPPTEPPGIPTFAMAAGRFDADDDVDLAATGAKQSDVFILMNQGGAKLQVSGQLTLNEFVVALFVSDLDLDGDQDILCHMRSARDSVMALFNDGAGRFAPGESFPLSGGGSQVTLADVDGEGDVDVAASLGGTPDVVIRLNDGRGRFPQTRTYPTSSASLQLPIAAADMDRDQDMDLVLFAGDAPMGGLIVLFNDGAGAFRSEARFELQEFLFPITMRVSDMDLDQDPDIVQTSFFICDFCQEGLAGLGGLGILLNDSLPATSSDENGNRIPDECEGRAFHRGDVSGDGILNLADALAALRFLFQGGSAPECLEAADAQDDQRVDIADAIVILAYLFQSGPPPAAPGPPGEPCGLDPDLPGSPGHLGCEAYTPCGV